MTRTKNFKPQAIIFDKDGTLISFDTMWGGWTIHLAEQIHLACGLDVRNSLALAMGYDEQKNKVLANSALASKPMAQLYDLTVDVIQSQGLETKDALKTVEKAWCIPDPIVLARPLTDLRVLFQQLSEQGIKVALATADDRTSTQATIDAFNVGKYISCMSCADDGIPSKPAPDMVLTLCEQMDVEPSKAMVVGDTISDLKMAHAAGAGLAVGVLSGVSSTKDLAGLADALIESVDELNKFVLAFAEDDSPQTNRGLNPDFAF